jgi:hypothetical protein
MCLVLKDDYVKATRRLKNRTKPIRAYKILLDNMRSLYLHSKWEVGENKSNRISTKISNHERILQEVEKGFHFFLNKDHAFNDRKNAIGPSGKVWEVEIQPEDIVAIGDFCKLSSVVATKATLVRVVKRRPNRDK